MSNILPVAIVSPAIITWNGYSYYAKVGIKSEFKRETFTIETSMDGKIDERMKSQRTEVSFQPAGLLTNLATGAAYFPYTVASIGSSIFGAAPLPLVIMTRFGGTGNLGMIITYNRAAPSKLPQLRLKPNDTLFGDMTFTCIGVPTVQPITAAAWNAVASATFTDPNSFDDTKIITDIYAAAYGTTTPYNVMGSMAGFELDITPEIATIEAADYGVVDMILQSLTATARFAPSNLTEAQVNALLGQDGTGFIWPGQSLSKANKNLVIVGSGNNGLTLTATIFNAGPKEAGFMYSTKDHRLEAVAFTSKSTWTTGSRNPLWSLATA